MRSTILAILALASALAHAAQTPAESSSVPIRWTVETSRAQVAQFEAYRGETLDLEATMKSYGSPLATPVQPSLYWQTNGMGAAWWTAPATASGNVIRATWSPTNDCGGTVYNCFIGQAGGNYRAAFRLRMLPSPGYTPNHLPLPTVTGESDPVFSSWLATNKFSSARAETVGTDSQWTDATGTVWQVAQKIIGDLYFAADREFENKTGPIGFSDYIYVVQEGTGFDLWLDDYGEVQGYPMSQLAGHDGWWKEDRSYGTYFFFPSYALVTNIVGRVALKGDIPEEETDPTVPSWAKASQKPTYTAEEVGAAPASLAEAVNAWQTYWDGDDVRITVTNYYGSLDIPALYIEQKMEANDEHSEKWFKTIWDERTRWNAFLSDYAAVTNEVAQNKADRAWGVYDSSSGEYSPDGLLQLSQEQVMIASGLAYQKTVTAGGCAVWVLKATNPTSVSGELQNGYFRISDGDGNPLFEIVKGDKRVVGAVATDVQVSSVSMTIRYNSVSDQHPVLEVCTDLSRADWQREDEATVASVAWSGSSGAWVATVTPVGARPHIFAKASYEAGGNTYIKNHVASSLDKVVVGGQEYTVTVQTINGKKLLVLE